MMKRMAARISAVAMAVVMMVSLMPVMGALSHGAVGMVEAKATRSGYYLYLENEDDVSITITEYLGSTSGEVDIPDVIDGYSVTNIGDGLFQGCSSLKSVTLPNSVTNIGEYAFDGCESLISIKISNGLMSIGVGAFYECRNLESITIPNGVMDVGKYAFAECRSLTSVEIPNSVTNIEEGTFYGCRSLTSVGIPNNVTNIGDSAFAECRSLTSVEIPNSVTNIGDSAFAECRSLTSVEIPNSITNIEGGTFYGCRSLTNVVVPDGVTSIGESAFSECNNLESVTLPNSVISIGIQAFSECSNLRSIEIPNSVTNIGNYAFAECSNLRSIEIPNSVTNIGNRAFAECNSLINIDVGENNEIYDSRENCNAIIETDSNTLIIGCSTTVIPISVTSIGDSAFSECSNLRSIEIPNGVTSIGEDAFWFCRGLTSVTIPSTVTDIGRYAFDGCENLTSIVIPNSITSIEEGVFMLCSSLENVMIPDSVTSIGDRAFLDCSSLKSVTIPNSVTNIGIYAFGWCESLTSIEIPNGVTSIGNAAFAGCNSLTGIVVDEYNKIYDSREECNAIIEMESNTLIIGCSTTVIPNGVTSIGDSAFRGVGNLTMIEIPDSVMSIGYAAFERCDGLTSIVIPNSVTVIGGNSFKDCTSLTSITIPNSITSIGADAFASCTSLTDIYYDGSEEEWNAIEIDYSGNSILNNVTIHYNGSSADKGSIRYIPKAALELTEEVGGVLLTDEKGELYYHYLFDLTEIGQIGDKLEVTDNEGNVSVYTLGTYNGALFFINEVNRRDRIDLNFLQSYDWATLQEKDHWYAGNTYSFHLSYEDMECELSVTVRENPVASIQFESQTEWLLFEGYSGQEVEDENGDTYFYYSDVDFQEGDTLTVSFSDGRVAEYEYTDEYFVNKENESDTIPAREVYPYDWCGVSSGNGHWQAGNTYQVQLSYNGRLSANTVPVKILTADETSVYLQKISGMIQDLPEESEFTLDDKDTITALNEIGYAEKNGLLDQLTGDLNKYYALQYAFWQLKNIPNLPEIKSGDTETVSISEDVFEMAWRFCPKENGRFMLTASSRYAIVNVMEDNKLIASVDDSNKLFFDAEAGHTYAIRCYYERERGSYTIQLTESPVEQHQHTLTKEDGKPATCTEDGYEAYWKCENCEELFADASAETAIEEPVVIPASGHTERILPAMAPTCEQTGLTAGSICSVCGTILSGQEVIPAAGHQLKSIEAIPATCETDGVAEYYYCTICGHLFDDEKGTTEIQEPEVITATGHAWGDWSLAETSSCIKEGQEIRVCQNEPAHVEYRSAGLSAHQLIFVEEKAPTHTEEGNIAYYTCEVCGEIFEDESCTKLLSEEDVIIPRIDTIDLSEAVISGIMDKPYNTEEITQSPVVVLGSKVLQENTDYIVAFRNNRDIGIATVTITGKGNYTGTVEKTFRIQFGDVTDPSVFYYDPIYWAADDGITTGWPDGTFRPLNRCNRASVVTFLWRLAGKPEPSEMASFTDMTDNEDFNKAISWAAEEGITTGWTEKDGSSTFRPWNTCNRAAIVTFLWRYAGEPDSGMEAAFTDMTGNSDFNKAISWAAEEGITTGWTEKDGSSTFRPWNTCNRLAIVSFLYRYANE